MDTDWYEDLKAALNETMVASHLNNAMLMGVSQLLQNDILKEAAVEASRFTLADGREIKVFVVSQVDLGQAPPSKYPDEGFSV